MMFGIPWLDKYFVITILVALYFVIFQWKFIGGFIGKIMGRKNNKGDE